MTLVKRRWFIALIAVLLQSALAEIGFAEVVDRIVAEVNNEIITMSELQNMARTIQAQSGIKPQGTSAKKMEREMLEALIDRKLTKAEAARRGIKVSDKEVDESLARFKQSNNIPDDEALVKGLNQAGISLNEFRQQIAEQIVQERMLAVVISPKIKVDDAEMRRIYEEKFKKSGVQVHLLTLRLPFPPGATDQQRNDTKGQTETIVQDVKRGESLTAAAAKFSLKTSDIGFVSLSDLDPRLAEYLSQLKPKELAPVETPEGYQLIQMVARRSGEARSFEEAAPEIRRLLQQQEMGKYFGEWVKNLREKAHIKIML